MNSRQSNSNPHSAKKSSSSNSSDLSDEKIRLMPKVELHRHLDCSMRISTLIELAQVLNISIPDTAEEIEEQFLIKSPMKDLESVLKKFTRSQQVLNSEEILARLTFETIEDAFHEGIRILELRWAPTYIEQGHEKLNFEKILRGIRRGAEMAKDLPIAVGFLAIAQRTLPVATAERVIDFAIDNKDFFVGVDLADNEAGFHPEVFAPAFQKARKNDLHVTIHAGEALIPEASKNVKSSIELLGAERIGHGVQIANDPFVTQLVREKAIPLELCLTSNWLTQAVPHLSSHPIRQLLNAGVPVTINTDDPGIFGIDLVHEYQLLRDIHNFSEADFNHCNDIAAQASFLPLLYKQKYWPKPIHSLR